MPGNNRTHKREMVRRKRRRMAFWLIFAIVLLIAGIIIGGAYFWMSVLTIVGAGTIWLVGALIEADEKTRAECDDD